MMTVTDWLNRLSSETYTDLIDRIRENLSQQMAFSHIITVNPSIMVHAQTRPFMRDWVQRSWVCLADGIGIIGLARWRGVRVQRRTGIQLAWRIAGSGLPVYCLGATPAVIRQAVQALSEQLPTFNCLGYQSGYEIDWDTLITTLRAQPAVILVGTGFPLQDEILQRLSAVLPYGVGIGIGGSFDIFSGRLSRAPLWVQSVGLEWVYRSIQQPARMKHWGVLFRFLLLFFKRT